MLLGATAMTRATRHLRLHAQLLYGSGWIGRQLLETMRRSGLARLRMPNRPIRRQGVGAARPGAYRLRKARWRRSGVRYSIEEAQGLPTCKPFVRHAELYVVEADGFADQVARAAHSCDWNAHTPVGPFLVIDVQKFTGAMEPASKPGRRSQIRPPGPLSEARTTKLWPVGLPRRPKGNGCSVDMRSASPRSADRHSRLVGAATRATGRWRSRVQHVDLAGAQ